MATIGGMRKTTVYLDEDSLREIKALAKETGRSEAALIREAVRAYVSRRPVRVLRCAGAGEGPEDLAERTEQLLADGFGR